MTSKLKQMRALAPLTLLLLHGCSAESHAPAGKAPEQIAEVATPASVPSAPAQVQNSVRLIKEQDGHFYADVKINNMPVRFMVDTGASSIALSLADAQALGLEFDEAEFTDVGRGVGGEVPMKRVVLESVDLGGINRRNVDAVIVNSDLSISLLGQSFLNSLGTLTIQGQEMILRQ